MRTSNTVSPLRQRMIEDITARNLGHHTQRSHIYSCKRFCGIFEALARYCHPRRCSSLSAVVEAGHSVGNRNRIMTGVKFLFRVTLRRHDLVAEIYHLPEPQKLPLTMSPNEAERLLDMAGSSGIT